MRPYVLKTYRTCTFQGLGSKKDKFLEIFVQEMGTKGFKKTAPVKSFKPSLGLKATLGKSTKSYLIELERYNMVSADVILKSDKNETIALRAKVNNNDLRFGYFFS